MYVKQYTGVDWLKTC